MDCGRWPLSVVRHKVGRGLGLSGFWVNMDWTGSAGSLTPLALDSSLLDSVVVVVVGCEWLDVRWCVQEVRQGWLHGFFPGMLDEVRVGQVGLVGKAMLDVLVVRDVQRCLAVDVGLAAVNGEPVVTVNGQGPASEGHEFRVGPARAMELLALRSMTMVLVREVGAALECTATPGPGCPDHVRALEKELWVVAWASVGWISEAGAWTEMHDVFANPVGMNVWDNGLPLAMNELGRRSGEAVKQVGLDQVPINLVDGKVGLKEVPIWIWCLHLVGAGSSHGHRREKKNGIQISRYKGTCTKMSHDQFKHLCKHK